MLRLGLRLGFVTLEEVEERVGGSRDNPMARDWL